MAAIPTSPRALLRPSVIAGGNSKEIRIFNQVALNFVSRNQPITTRLSMFELFSAEEKVVSAVSLELLLLLFLVFFFGCPTVPRKNSCNIAFRLALTDRDGAGDLRNPSNLDCFNFSEYGGLLEDYSSRMYFVLTLDGVLREEELLIGHEIHFQLSTLRLAVYYDDNYCD